MIRLDAGNVMLKPSHRRQLMTWLKRSLRLGQQLGDFVLSISLRRAGRGYEARATVHDTAGDFACRVRRDSRHVPCSSLIVLHWGLDLL